MGATATNFTRGGSPILRKTRPITTNTGFLLPRECTHPREPLQTLPRGSALAFN